LSRRIAIFFPYNPFPFAAGNQKRVRQIILAMTALGFETHFLSMDFFEERWNAEGRKALEAMGVASVRIYPVTRADRLAWKFLKKRDSEFESIRTSLNPPFLKLWFMKQMTELQPSAVIINYAYWGNLSSAVPRRTVKILETHDLVSSNAKLRKRLGEFFSEHQVVTRGLFERFPPFLWEEDAWSGKNFEADAAEYKILDRFDWTVALSASESERIRTNSRKTRVVLAPYAPVPVEIGNTYAGAVLFPAGRHLFNTHAYLYFLKKIWPLIRMKVPEFTLRVSGKMKERMFAEEGIELLPYESDMTPWYRESCFAVCPVPSGTGQPVKIAEVMAHGLPVVTSGELAYASPVSHGKTGYIASTPEEFAGYCLRLWRDRDLCSKLGENAKEWMRNITRENSYEKVIERAMALQERQP
jgi:glycosyltransferase involved in cell wall biosynthesis